MTFAEIIHPITIREFFEEYYEKKMLHIARADAGYYHQFLSPEEIDGYVQLNQTYSPNVKLAYQGKEISPLEFCGEIGSIAPYQVDQKKLLHFFDQGYTIKYDKLHQTYPPLAAKVSNIEQELGIKIRTSLYVTPENTQGYGIHTDRHDVLGLQINGTKMWKVKMAEEKLPSVYKAAVKVKWEEQDGIDVIEVNSGDFFYCPRGLAHDVYTQGSPSTHFTLGLKPVYRYELFNSLSKEAYKKEYFRKAIPNNYTSKKEVEVFKDQIKSELLKIVDDLSVDDLLRESKEQSKGEMLNFSEGLFFNRFYEPAPDDRFKIKDHWSFELTKVGVRLVKKTQHYNFPMQTKSVFEKIFKEQYFKWSDLRFEFSSEQNKKIALRLLQIGAIKKEQ